MGAELLLPSVPIAEACPTDFPPVRTFGWVPVMAQNSFVSDL
jgi:hypothetical protein